MATGRVNIGSSSNEANVFIQSTEPSEKEGIWFQAPFKDYDKLSIGNFGQIIQESIFGYVDNYGEMAYGLYENFFILLGGKSSGSFFKYFYKYDLARKVWTRLPDSTGENMYTAIIGHNNILYLIGSYYRANTVSRFDLESNTWLSTLSAPNAIFGSAVVKVNGKIYKVGGSSDGSTYLALHYVLDPSTGTWTQLSNCPISRPGSSMNIMPYKNGYYLQYSKDIYYYNIDTNTWTLEKTLTSSSSPLNGFGVIISDTIFFNVGGYIYEYNILTKTERSTTLATDIGKCNLMYNDRVLIPKFVSSTSGVLRYTDVNYKRSNNYVILCENQDNGFDTCLFNVVHRKINNRITQQITNALLYINDVEQVVPTYYGDGTQWVKFKN